LSELAIQNRLTICTSLTSLRKRKQFLYQIVIDDEKSTIIILSVKNRELVHANYRY